MPDVINKNYSRAYFLLTFQTVMQNAQSRANLYFSFQLDEKLWAAISNIHSWDRSQCDQVGPKLIG